MCGILFSSKEIQEIKKTLKYLKKRGPDHTEYKIINNYHFIHVLLSMTGENYTIQPFVYDDIVIMFNGEIYNFRELDAKYNLNIGTSDCKTIPELYCKLGEEKWAKLFDREVKGEYAFVLLEFNKLKNLQKIVIGRDMIGIRPLYFHEPNRDSKQLIFSSEIKGTMNFKDTIKEFPPGNVYSYSVNEFADLSLKKYNFEWVYDVKQVYGKSISWYLGNVRRAVTNAVMRRLNSDRPLAFLVSGGVDSSLVAGIAAKILGKPLNTFCCVMVGGTDLKYAKMVANHIKSNHKEVYFTKEEGLKSLDEVVYCTETRDATTIRASVGQFLVSKHIGTMTDCRVVLVGEDPASQIYVRTKSKKLKSLSSEENFLFKGYIEGNNIMSGDSNVIVTDGFTGNVALKTAEGTANFIVKELKNAMTGSLLGKISSILNYYNLNC